MEKKLVIIPTYNEIENISRIIQAVFELPGEYQILVIDDGSPDGTADVVKGLLDLKDWQVENCAELFADGDTIPFISRYRKEKTGGMDDAEVAEVRHWVDVFFEMDKRKETILKVIDEAGALTDELREKIEQCVNATELEDLYLPWRPKRRTRATAARELGLEPLWTVTRFPDVPLQPLEHLSKRDCRYRNFF